MTTVQRRDIRLHGKGPLVAHIERSYAMRVRDGIMTRVKAMPWFAPFTFSTNKSLQIQPEALPFCGVYMLQEAMFPDGNSDAGEPRFRTSVRIGFSVIIVNNDADAAEYQLDTAMQALMGGLLSDPTLYNNSEFKIQGYTSAQRIHLFGNSGLDNQTPIAELRFELVCDLGTITYPPLVTDDLEVIHVESPTPVDGVVVEYDVDQ